jgi:hypothetical protein
MRRVIERWERAPGYDRLLDRANEAVMADISHPGHCHHVSARDKSGGIDFEASPQPPFDYICSPLRLALDSLESESLRTCEECGAPGEERPQRPYHTLCDEHAARESKTTRG